MTSLSPDASSPSLGAWLAINAEKVIRYGGLAFVAGAGFAGAFRHMHDWTAEELPLTPGWLCWANAVISEILPMVSFLSWRDRSVRGRKTGLPLTIFVGSALVSLTAQLTAAGADIPGAPYFLAALPMLAVLVLSKMVFSDLEYARRDRVAVAAEAAKVARAAEQAAELKRRNAELTAERAAELAAELARQQAAEAAELDRLARERAAELAERQRAAEAAERLQLAELEQAAITRRDQLAADERRVEREARLAIEREAALAEAAGRAQAERLRAEADAVARRIEAEAAAARDAAETVRLETETKIRQQAVSHLNGRHRAVGEGGGTVPRQTGATDLDEARRSRRPREETETLVDAVLSTMPADATRADAVKAVSAELSITGRQASKFVPKDWTAASSAAGSGNRAA